MEGAEYACTVGRGKANFGKGSLTAKEPTGYQDRAVVTVNMRGKSVGTEVNNNKTNFILLSVLDHFLSAVVVAPAVVGYWRGTWNLSDLYLFPGNEDISMLSSLVFGFLGQLVFTHAQHFLADNLDPHKNGKAFYASSRIYTYVFGVVCVNLWRGIWKALDMFSGQSTVKVLIPTVTSVVFLAVSRTLRNVSASPFIVAVDLVEGYFAVPTMFKLTGSKVDSLYVLDSLFSVFVVGCLVVFAWRGVWCLIDIYLFPTDEFLSANVSLIFGYVVVLVVFCLQSPMKKLCDSHRGFWRLALLDLYILLSFIGTINVWRGIWNLLNLHFLHDSPALSCWITHLGCFAFLMIIKCSNSLLVRGVAVDGEEEGGECAVFPTSYLRTFFASSHFKRYCKEECNKLGIGGWVKTTARGTVIGKLEGPKMKLDQMISWLSYNGSPGSQIKQCRLYNYEYLRRAEYRGFSVRF